MSIIACENSLPGDPPSDWRISGSGDSTIQGFATTISVNAGETVSFKINTPANSYHFDVLRIGYYQGNGARIVAGGLLPTAKLPQSQPSCLTDSTTGLIDCGNWGVSASWAVPTSAVSGVYVAHLVRNDTGGDSLIPFVVRNDTSTSAMLVQTSDETWQAYNTYGGNSLYQCSVACPPGNPGGYKGAYKVSYNRPFNDTDTQNGLLSAEYPMIRFLEANGYDVNYTSGLDVATRGSLLTNHKIFLSVGHDEYWSGDQRSNVEAARDHGVNLSFFSGNEVFWKTRWEPSIDASNAAGRTLVTYKETHFDAPADPQDPPTWTGTWRDPRFSPPADARAENSLTGQFFIVNAGTTDIQVPAAYGKLRLWRNTAVASLSPGQTLTLGSGIGTLGYEWDEDADNGSRPAGLVDLSSTTSSAQVFTDYGTNVASGLPATHKLTLYRAASGALVFGAGTVQWSWGLDGATTGKAPDPNMQQATVNLFADQGAQPSTPIAGLTAAVSSSDSTAPTSVISAPLAGASLADGATFTITGTANDNGGGVVAGVEISTDGGGTWHPAGGTNNWAYTWIAHGNPTTTIKTRAVDDSGNLETPGPGVTIGIACPCSVWGPNITPGGIDSGDGSGVEVGMKFTAQTSGKITGVRFYKSSTNTGTHIGNLWSATGQSLGQGIFTNETASGWQQLNFSTPISITANTPYIVSYYAPVGHYSQDAGYMYLHPSPQPDGNDSLDSPPLHVLRNTQGTANGLYSYSSSSTFPTNTYHAENYWVDVVFSPSTPSVPGAPTNVTATAGNGSAGITWTAPSNGGSTITSYTITPYMGTTALAPTTITGNPAPTSAAVTGLTNGTAYTFTVAATNATGTGPASTASNPVTPAAPTAPAAPTNVTATAGNGSAGITWTAPSNGGSTMTSYTITPYMGTAPQATTTTITGLPPGTSATITGLSNGTAYTFTVSATNSIGSGPASTASNTITPASTPAAPTNVSATAAIRSAALTWTAPSNGGSLIISYTITPYIGTTAQNSTTLTGTPPGTSITITGLKNGTTYTFTVRATNQVGTGPASSPSNAVTPTPH